MSHDAVLSIDGLHLTRGAQAVLRGVTLALERGERMALMGLSGGGKTTVLRAVAALDAFSEGRIEVGGFTLHAGALPRESRLRPLRHRVGIVFQFHHLFTHLDVMENLVLAPVHALGIRRDVAEARARELLESLGVSSRAHARPFELSGGEAQRVAIARALATDPPLLLMDEPTASLDPARRGELGATLTGLAAAGRTLLVATHDIAFARSFASRVAILADGVIVEDGPPEQVLETPAHPATRLFLRAPEARAPQQGSGAGLERHT